MLQFRKHGVVITAAVHSPVVASADLRIQCGTLKYRHCQRVLVKIDVSR